MSYKSNLRNNTIILTTGTIINKGFQFIAVLLYSKWLTVDEYGEFDVLCTYISLLLPIITLSTQEALFRLSVNDENHKRDYVSSAFFFDLLLFAVLATILFVLFNDKMVLLIFFLGYLLAEVISTYFRGFLRSIKRLDLYSYGMILQTFLVFLFVSFFILKMKYGLVGILLGYAIGTALGDLALAFWGQWYRYFSARYINIHRYLELVKYSAPLIPNEISWWVMNASDRQIISVAFGSGANGIYAIAHKVPAICSLMFNMFSISWQQEIVDRLERKELNETNETNETFNTFLCILFTFCSMIVAFDFFFYYFYWDKKYFSAIQYSPILVLAALETAVIQFVGGIQTAFKQTRSIGISTAVGGVCNIAFHIALIGFVGLYAAAISTAVSNFVVLIIRHFNVRRYFNLKIYPSTICCFLLFVIFFIASFFHSNLIFDFCVFFISAVIFVLVNKSFLISILDRK